MKVLLTGATGFIGCHVARELLHRGHEVHCTVRPSSDRRRIQEIEAKLQIHAGGMDEVPIQPDLAIHLAWHAVPGKYLSAPENRECLEASRRLLAKLKGRVLFAGTCFEFDTRLGRLSEESPTRPTTLYAECKDALRRDVGQRPDSVWVRFFYQYGPWEDDRRLIPSVIRNLLRGEPAKVSPGKQRRDFLHVGDVASAVCDIAQSRLEGPVNIGSGQAPMVREILTKIGALIGRPDLIHLGAVPYYEGEPMLIQADNAKLRSIGWSPKLPLDLGLRQAVEWWKGM